MSHLVLTSFAHAESSTPRQESLTWELLVKRLTEPHLPVLLDKYPLLPDETEEARTDRAKKAQSMFSPCEFSGSRKKENAIRVHFGVLDLDGISVEDLEDIVNRVTETGVDAVLYTSFSNDAGYIALRLIVPFTRPVLAHQWKQFWPRFNAFFGNYSDPQTKDVNRCYFYPATLVERLQFAYATRFDGRGLLEVDDLLLSPTPVGASYGKAPSHTELTSWAKTLLKTNHRCGEALFKILEGEPWADKGDRDVLLFEVCGEIARKYPHANAQELSFYFSRSVSHFPDFDLNIVQDKLERQQAYERSRLEKKSTAAAQNSTAQINRAFRGERTAPYSPQEVETFAAESFCSVEDFKRRWIIQKGSSYYFYVAGRGYIGPYGKEEGKLAAHTFLAPAQSVGVALCVLSDRGETVHRNIDTLVMEYGTIADRVVLDLTAKVPRFDAKTSTLVEAPCPLREIAPKFDIEVDRWLRILGGSDYALLETWLSWCTELRRPSVALFLEGAPGSGKTLLAQGLARLWSTNGPTTMEQAFGPFNSAIATCPLVLADEKMPTNFRGAARTSELREFVQATQRPYKRKYLPDTEILGAIRAVVTANNRSILEGETSLTVHDVQAIVGRFLHIDLNRSNSSEYLKTVNTWEKGWLDKDVLPAHILWIAENVERDANPPRFLVQQPNSAIARSMSTSSAMGSAVAHWLMSFVLNPEALRAGKGAVPSDSAHLVRIIRSSNGKPRLYASPRTLSDYWDKYRTNTGSDKATIKAILSGIQGISTGRRRVPMPSGARADLYEIRIPDLIEWAEASGFADEVEILECLERYCDVTASDSGE